jgi:hypothetical protein
MKKKEQYRLSVYKQTKLKINNENKQKQARRQWLMPVILATQEAEIRRIEVQSSHRLPQKKSSQKQGWWSGSKCRF